MKRPALPVVVLSGSVVLAVAALLWAWTPDLSRATLEARWLAAPGDLRRVGDTRLHVRDEGPRTAPVVVLLHGFGSSLHTWDAWSAALARTHRVVRLDLPGHGLSDPDPAGDYRDERSHARLAALLDDLGVRRATVVGHSIGGRIAWSFTAARPDRVERLVLVAPDGFASPGFDYGRAPEVPGYLDAIRWFLPRAAVRGALAPAYADPAVLTDALLDRYADLMRAPGIREAFLRRMRQTVLHDPRPGLRSIRVPTLLVWGERDAMIPAGNARDYLDAIAGSTATVLAHAGHVPHEEAPQASLAALQAFLARP